MNNIKSKLAFICLFILPFSAYSAEEDSAKVSLKLSLRYVLGTSTTDKTSRTISKGEIGNIPISMNLYFDIQPLLWMSSPIKNVFIVSDSRFHQDRTSSEFGLGFRKENIEISASYGFRAIRRDDDESTTRALSSNYDNKATKSLGVSFHSEVFGVNTFLNAKASYDGNSEWFYLAEFEIFPFSKDSPIHVKVFYESYLGSGTYLVFTSRNDATSFFSGYLFPDNYSEKVYRRNEGILFGLTHTWR